MSGMVFDGCDVTELAERFGTPLYVMSETELRRRMRAVKSAFSERYEDVEVLYAGKAFLPRAMCALVKSEGLGLDVVSSGEIHTAVSVGFPMERAYFHGNNKTAEDMAMAMDVGVGRFVVDNRDELDLLASMAEESKTEVSVLFRLAPGVSGDTHRYIQTAHTDCKFGMPLLGEGLRDCVETAMKAPYVKLLGFHFHVGSQLMENRAYLEALGVLGDLMKTLREEIGFETKELNVGGGIGIPYGKDQREVDLDSFLGCVVETAERICSERGMARPRLVIEPGRWIVGPSGITLYRVGTVKEIPGIRTYVSVDGGMTDNPRPSLYQAEYRCVLANRMDEQPDSVVTVAGRCCESGDILIKDAELPLPERGDVVAVFDTGAYNFSMASGYNRLRRPAVVLVKDGEARCIVERQSFDDLIKGESVPEDLL
ncbi:diaminopimelate decarboxylase [Dethiosulfovibrio sp. F2B]|uniref:diaminopimelate decarboxylase n=1 Tax=Dethiosulfovibrio faecalis TaxID=2720018 RepID=UPI001F16CDA6|nr:diaminopimelate decarboxylase [Dethiosulfovibrio faecalis]MCF4151535.1 diaminopimelate decarboxylase [Dethiosulfovibrio faecalis]